MNIDLSGRRALVTGGSGGLGRTISKTLAGCGADVAVHYHSDEKSALKTVEEIQALGRRSAAFRCDITKQESVNDMRDSIQKSFGMPDILVVNAVIQYEWKKLLDQDIKDYYSQFESCEMQFVYMLKAFLPHMREQHYGRIAVTNTECAVMAEAGCSAYTAAKRGLDGMVRVAAKEYGADGITINQVAPGWTITDKERESGVNPAPEYVASVPLARRGTDTDIANVTAFLCSDLASFVTGAFIPVAGGRVMTAI